jgi:HK97 family phage prohead protease
MAHIGFQKLEGILAAKGAHNPGALAAYIGRKKYTAAGMAAKAAAARAKHKALHHGHSSERAALHVGMERRSYPAEFEVRGAPDGTGGTRYSLTGYATVYGQSYQMVDKHGEYREQVRPGAGQRTLAQSPDVQLLINHTDLPLARTKSGTLRLTEDSRGLHVDADLDPTDPDVQRIQPKMKRGDLSEMSFAFRTTRQEWSDDYTRREIVEYNLHRGDVSLVTFGANPTTNAAMRAQDFDLLDEESARVLYERLARRFQTPPPAAMPLRLALALAQAQG